MQPRLASSKKWTPFPTEFSEKIVKVFSDNFKIEAEAGEFLVEGRIYPEEVLVRVGYLESGRLRQINFEASVDYDKVKANATEKIYLAVDAVGSFMEQYFDDPDEAEEGFPLQWHGFETDKNVVYLQFSTVNSKLEEEADRLLGLSEKALVHEDVGEENEDALANAVIDNELAAQIQKEIRKGSGLN